MPYTRLFTILSLLFLVLSAGLSPAPVSVMAVAQPTYRVNEPSPRLTGEEWRRVLDQIDRDAHAGDLTAPLDAGTLLVRQEATINAADGAAYDRFGNAVSLSGDTLAVGATGSGDQDAQGAVYLFERNNGGADAWGQVAKLAASDGASGDRFGVSVAISGDTLAVGADGDDNLRGAVYLFERNYGGMAAWGQVKKLTAADGAANEFFGEDISLDGNRLAVGAWGDDSYRGAVYLFERNQGGADAWGQVKKLVAADGTVSDQFGGAVSLSGDRLAVGVYRLNGMRGAVYLFERNSGGADAWGQIQKLTAADGVAGDHFGGSVSLSGDRLVVGSIGNNSARGAAYLFERNSGGADAWGQVKKLTAADGVADDRFGDSVFLSSGYLAIGSPGNDSMRGAVYLFERNSGGADAWGQVKKVTAADGAEYDRFGNLVFLSGDRLAVGAYGDDSSRGAVYLFERNHGGADAWGQVKKITAADGTEDDRFGDAISLIGDRLAVGAFGKANMQGAAYLFERNHGGADAWGQVKTLTAADGAMFGCFGYSVSLSGDRLAVGAWMNNGSQGAVYLFERNSGGANAWAQAKKVTAVDGAVNDYFGYSISLSGDRLAVGAGGFAAQRGAAYLFERNQGGVEAWGQVVKLTASDGAAGDNFGDSISLSGDRLAVGAYGHDLNRGAVYMFERNKGGADAWGQAKKLSPVDRQGNGSFGFTVSLSDNRLAVGVFQRNNGRGSAYLFFAQSAEAIYLPVVWR